MDLRTILSTFESLPDWRTQVTFSPDHYTRRLIETNKDWEVIVMGWEPGQGTPLHDHPGCDCLMMILEGEIKEDLYDSSCNHMISTTYSQCLTSFVNDKVGIHRLTANTKAVTLHIYAPPLREVFVYDPVTKEKTLATLAIDS